MTQSGPYSCFLYGGRERRGAPLVGTEPPSHLRPLARALLKVGSAKRKPATVVGTVGVARPLFQIYVSSQRKLAEDLSAYRTWPISQSRSSADCFVVRPCDASPKKR